MDNNLLKKPSEEEILAFVKESSPLKETSLTMFGDRFIIHKIAKMLGPGSVAVEIGTYLGSSAALMAHANKQLEVHSYDLFNDIKYDPTHDSLVAMALGEGSSRSLENVQKYVSQYTNIFLHKVDVGEKIFFDRKIDLFIEDACHRDPQLSNSLAYWLPKVNINGFVLLHDYRPWLHEKDSARFLDVEKHVDMLSTHEDWYHLGNFSCFAIFQRIQ
jgi:hypothetical protein